MRSVDLLKKPKPKYEICTGFRHGCGNVFETVRGHLVLYCLFNYVNIADGPVLGFAWAIMFLT